MKTGSCLCRAVTLTIAGDLPQPNFCHCRMCRKQTGHYLASTDVPRKALTVTGEEASPRSPASVTARTA